MKLFLPAGKASLPSIVALHGCGGTWAKRDDGWARYLVAHGHAVLLSDSYAAHGLKPECKQSTRGAHAYGSRRQDALAAANWLQAQHLSPQSGILILGSDGGTTVLASIAAAPDMSACLILGDVAFYPSCTRTVNNANWHNASPLLILMEVANEWTPPFPCQELVRRNLDVSLKLFPGSYQDFDVLPDPVHQITGLPYTKFGIGIAHAGENSAVCN